MSDQERKWMRRLSWVIGFFGGVALIQAAGPLAAAGVCLVLWGNNLYEASKRADEVKP